MLAFVASASARLVALSDYKLWSRRSMCVEMFAFSDCTFWFSSLTFCYLRMQPGQDQRPRDLVRGLLVRPAEPANHPVSADPNSPNKSVYPKVTHEPHAIFATAFLSSLLPSCDELLVAMP